MPSAVSFDGVDYIPMPMWKTFLVQLLNIAGLGPIFGAVLGAAYGLSLIHISSSSNSGGFSATVTFDISTDPDLAAVDIQNRLKKAEARLPAEVVQNGISVEKQAASKLMTITLLSSCLLYTSRV